MYILVADGMLELAVHAVEQLLHGVVPEVTSEVHYKYIYIYIYVCLKQLTLQKMKTCTSTPA